MSSNCEIVVVDFNLDFRSIFDSVINDFGVELEFLIIKLVFS